jgi:hypothetical protein
MWRTGWDAVVWSIAWEQHTKYPLGSAIYFFALHINAIINAHHFIATRFEIWSAAWINMKSVCGICIFRAAARESEWIISTVRERCASFIIHLVSGAVHVHIRTQTYNTQTRTQPPIHADDMLSAGQRAPPAAAAAAAERHNTIIINKDQISNVLSAAGNK